MVYQAQVTKHINVDIWLKIKVDNTFSDILSTLKWNCLSYVNKSNNVKSIVNYQQNIFRASVFSTQTSTLSQRGQYDVDTTLIHAKWHHDVNSTYQRWNKNKCLLGNRGIKPDPHVAGDFSQIKLVLSLVKKS